VAARLIPRLALLTVMSCGPSVSQLVERGQYAEACSATDYTYSRVLADRLADRSKATVTVALWSPADTYREAGAGMAPAPHGEGWHVFVVELVHPAGSPVAEIGIDGVALRADGWNSRSGEIGFGEAYEQLTGTTFQPPKGLSLREVASAARAAILNPADRDKLVEAFRIGGGTADPDGVIAAERLVELAESTCFAPPGSSCRAARVLVPGAAATTTAGFVIRLRYRVRDANGALCDQREQIGVPLGAAGPDLASQLAAGFPGAIPLGTLRARGRVGEARAEPSTFEGEWSTVTQP